MFHLDANILCSQTWQNVGRQRTYYILSKPGRLTLTFYSIVDCQSYASSLQVAVYASSLQAAVYASSLQAAVYASSLQAAVYASSL